ncbi:MAG: choice-of-anchor J domain-containing protein [Clostridium sp.]|nr:choice-of-anchor J domain-containing protein [Clostridium sp.]
MIKKRLLSLPTLVGAALSFAWAGEDLPYHKDLRSETALDDMTVIDVNNDGKTWTASTVGARYGYHRTNPGDDWLITPALNLQAGKAYELKVEIGSYNSYNEEKYEIYLGNAATAEAMTIQAVGPTATKIPFKNDPTPKAEAVVQVPTSGEWHIGVHAISEKNKMTLYCMSISMEQGVSPASPAALEEVSFVPEPTGAFSVDISFKAAAKTYVGDPISQPYSVNLQRDGDIVKTFTVQPGEVVKYTDELQHIGMYSYVLTPFNDEGGEGKGTASGKIFVGPYGAAAPAKVNVEETDEPGMVRVFWDPVTRDIQGTEIKAENVKYNIYSRSAMGGYETSFLEPFPENEKTIKALYDPSKQTFVSYTVAAFNRGMMGPYSEFSDLMAIGAPYQMPVKMSGQGNDYVFASDNTKGVAWSVRQGVDDAMPQDYDGALFCGIGEAYGQTGDLLTGKIDLTNAEGPLLEFWNYRFKDDDNTITVFVRADGKTEQLALIKHTDMEVGQWTKFRYSLAAYKGKVVQIIFQAKINRISGVVLDNISIAEALAYDLMVDSFFAPAQVTHGQNYKVNVTVKNDGAKTVSGAKAVLCRDGEVAESKDIPALEANQTTSLAFDQTLTMFHGTKAEYRVEIEYAQDMNMANNVSETLCVKRKVNSFDGVANVQGIVDSQGTHLSWDAIDTTVPQGMEMTEDFETAETFADEFGDWTLLDLDGEGIGYIMWSGNGPVIGPSIPKHPALSPAGFFVWDTSTRFSGAGNAHSGKHFLASMYRNDEYFVNDWAISPTLNGKAQTISFYAQAYNDGDGDHPENLQIWVSESDSNNPEDFELLTTFGDNGTQLVYTVMNGSESAYTPYTAELPAGTQRFAFASVAKENFMLMIDDVTFTPHGSINPLAFVGYNVYRNGQKINSEVLTEPSYLDAAPAASRAAAANVYHVTAVYEPGESELSEAWSETSSLQSVSASYSVKAVGNEIIVSGARGQQVSIYSVDGKLVYTAAGDCRVSLPGGFHIVAVGEYTKKVML